MWVRPRKNAPCAEKRTNGSWWILATKDLVSEKLPLALFCLVPSVLLVVLLESIRNAIALESVVSRMSTKFIKNFSFLLVSISLICGLCSCGNSNSASSSSVSKVDQARADVVNKWRTSSDEFETPKYIEDIYKQYPEDSVISNIYFYCISKQQYEYYTSLKKESYLRTAEEYAQKIDPDYTGEFSQEITQYASNLLKKHQDSSSSISHSEAKSTTDKYNSLTNSDKKKICEYIQSRYDYYDSLNGGYAGDKYTDIIWQEAMNKYGLTSSQLDVIWMNGYSY